MSKSTTRPRTDRRARRAWGWNGIVIAAVLSLLATVAAGAPFAEHREEVASLLESLESRFEILTLTESYALRPLAEDAGFRLIEVRPGLVAVDGEPMNASGLRSLVSEDAETLLTLAALGSTATPSEDDSSIGANPGASLSEDDELSEDGELSEEDADVLQDRVQQRIDDLERQLEEQEKQARELEERATELRREKIEELRERVDRKIRTGSRVSFSSLTVKEDETASDVVVLAGSLDMRGEVEGDVTVVGGSADIDGLIEGNVTVIGGPVKLGPDADIEGELVSVGGSVQRDPDARVRGELVELSFLDLDFFEDLDTSPWKGKKKHRSGFELSNFFWLLFTGLLLTGLVLLVTAIMPNFISEVADRARKDSWKSALVGLLVQILFFPALFVVSLVLIVSIVGIPIAVVVIPASLVILGALFLVGYSGVARVGGGMLAHRFDLRSPSPYLLALLGILLIQGWSLLGAALGWIGGPIWLFAGLLALTGFLIKYTAWTVGLGAVLLQWSSPLPSSNSAVLPPPLPPDGGSDADIARDDVHEDADREEAADEGADDPSPQDDEVADEDALYLEAGEGDGASDKDGASDESSDDEEEGSSGDSAADPSGDDASAGDSKNA